MCLAFLELVIKKVIATYILLAFKLNSCEIFPLLPSVNKKFRRNFKL